MSQNPNPSTRISTRSIMAVAIAVLVLTLSVELGFVSEAWRSVKTSFHRSDVSEVIHPELNHAVPLPPPRAFMVPVPPAPPIPLEEEVFTVVETAPYLPAGMDALIQEIRYPELARRAGISGRVFLTFIVEKDGTPSHIDVTRGIGGGCDEEAVRALQAMAFVPGVQRGQPVRVKMTLPIVFRLN